MTLALPAADSSRPGGSSPRWRAASNWGSLVLSAALAAASVGWVGSRHVLARLQAIDTRWLGVAFAIGIVQLGLLGLRWSRIARSLGMELGWLRATTEYALLGNQVLARGLAGDGLRGIRQARHDTRGAWVTLEALALDRAAGQLALGLVVLLTAPLSMKAGFVSAATTGLTLAFAALSLGAIGWAIVRRPAFGPREARLRPPPERASGLLYLRRAALHLPLSVSLVGCNLLQLYVAARALGVALPGLELCWLGPLVLVAASVPAFFGGWGVRECACALLFAASGLANDAGVAMSVAYGAFALIINLPALALLLFDGESAAPGHETPWSYANAASMIVGSLVAAYVGYPPLLGFVATICCFILIAHHQGSWTPTGHFGGPNLITTARLGMTMALLFAYGRAPGWQLAAGAAAVLLLDAADGWLARKTGQFSAFGASYDVEVDALLVMAISLLLFSRGTAGVWVLLAGLLRYSYVLAPALFPTPVGQAPRSRHGRVVYVTMLTCFMAALTLEGLRGRLLALVGTLAITLSFSHSFWQRYAGVRGAQPR